MGTMSETSQAFLRKSWMAAQIKSKKYFSKGCTTQPGPDGRNIYLYLQALI